MVHQPIQQLRVVLRHLQRYHHLLRSIGSADNERPQITGMQFQIIQRHAILKNIISHGQPDGVGWVGLEVAVVNGQHLIETTGYMKAHRPLIDRLIGSHFSARSASDLRRR